MKQRWQSVLLGSLLITLLVVLSTVPARAARSSHDAAAKTQSANVLYVIDGDTFEVSLAGHAKRIRIIGIDTPETKDPRKPVQCFGKQATDEATKLLTKGATVTLTRDAATDNRDKYHRLLRSVALVDGTDFGEKMITNGFAREYTYRDQAYAKQAAYQAAETAARKAERGLWAPAACPKKGSSRQ